MLPLDVHLESQYFFGEVLMLSVEVIIDGDCRAGEIPNLGPKQIFLTRSVIEMLFVGMSSTLNLLEFTLTFLLAPALTIFTFEPIVLSHILVDFRL